MKKALVPYLEGLFAISAGLTIFGYEPARAHVYSPSGEIIPNDSFFADGTERVRFEPGQSAPARSVGVLYTVSESSMYSCTAFVLDVAPEGASSAPAYAMSAGHCYGTDDTRAIHVAPADDGSKRILYLSGPDGRPSQPFAVVAVEYATMHGQDLMLMRLDVTARQLRNEGYPGLKFTTETPRAGTKAELLSFPLPTEGLRRSSCETGRIQSRRFLTPGDSVDGRTLVRDGVAHKCSSIDGVSGAPLLESATGRVVGIQSMSSELSPAYFEKFPSAVRPHVVGYNTAASVAGVARCFDESGLFDLGAKACGLARPRGMEELRSACAAGDRRACFDSGDIETACALGDPIACADQLAADFSDDARLASIETRVLSAKLGQAYAACMAGSAVSCELFVFPLLDSERSASYAEANGKSADLQMFEAIIVGCDLGSVWSCSLLGELHAGHGRDERDTKVALRAWATACAARGSGSCERLSMLYRNGAPGLEPSPELADVIQGWWILPKPADPAASKLEDRK